MNTRATQQQTEHTDTLLSVANPIPVKDLHSWHKEINTLFLKNKPYANNTLTIEQLWDYLHQGFFQFWNFPVGNIVTQYLPHKLILVMVDTTLEGYEPYLAVIEQRAKEWGCKQIDIYGRKGWQKVLKDYEPKLVHYVKELT